MNHERRNTLKAGTGLGLFGFLAAAGLVTPGMAQAAWNKEAFDAKSVDTVLSALGAGKPTDSTEITITAPEIAENGAVVPVTVVSNLPNTQEIAILVEKNPNMLAAKFSFAEGAVADVQTRIKMGQSSDVLAVVKADGKFYVAKKEVKVTLGGCGG
jgi:sulfur-oxidizing protein SoxY